MVRRAWGCAAFGVSIVARLASSIAQAQWVMLARHVVGRALGDKLSHILVSSAHTGPQPDAAAMITQNVLRVCQEMKVECSRAPR